MFRITMNKGFQVTFENGNTISVQFGYGNYCENRNAHEKYPIGKYVDFVECETAEIAIWDKNDIWFTRQCFSDWYGENIGDDVKGYVSADMVADIMFRLKEMK